MPKNPHGRVFYKWWPVTKLSAQLMVSVTHRKISKSPSFISYYNHRNTWQRILLCLPVAPQPSPKNYFNISFAIIFFPLRFSGVSLVTVVFRKRQFQWCSFISQAPHGEIVFPHSSVLDLKISFRPKLMLLMLFFKNDFSFSHVYVSREASGCSECPHFPLSTCSCRSHSLLSCCHLGVQVF